MQYFFHIESPCFACKDDDGDEFPNLESASTNASLVAEELREEGEYVGGCVVIADARQSVVLRVAI